MKPIARANSNSIHSNVCLNIKASFITHKSSKSEHRIQMYRAVLTLLNLTATGCVNNKSGSSTWNAQSRTATTASSCAHIWSRYCHSGTITLLCHLQILLQMQPGVGLSIPKWHNRPVTCFKVRINVHRENTWYKTLPQIQCGSRNIPLAAHTVKHLGISSYLQKAANTDCRQRYKNNLHLHYWGNQWSLRINSNKTLNFMFFLRLRFKGQILPSQTCSMCVHTCHTYTHIHEHAWEGGLDPLLFENNNKCASIG